MQQANRAPPSDVEQNDFFVSLSVREEDHVSLSVEIEDHVSLCSILPSHLSWSYKLAPSNEDNF